MQRPTALDALLEGRRQRPEVPRGQAGSLDRRRGGRHGLADRGGELAPQRLQLLGLAERLAPGVLDAEGHAQVVRDLAPVPLAGPYAEPRAAAQGGGELVDQVLPGRGIRLGQSGSRVVRRGHEVLAGGLGQGLDQGGRQLLAHPGHEPVEALVAHLVEDLDGDVAGDAVGVRARLELVGQPQLQLALTPGLRVVGADGRVGALGDDHVLGEGQQVRRLVPRGLPPRVEVPPGHDGLGDAGVVEREQLVVVDQDVAAPRALLQLGDLLEQAPVVVEEVVAGVPVPLHERVPDEQLARQHRVDATEAGLAPRDERYAVERDALQGDRSGSLSLPVGFGIRPLDQVRAETLRPGRVDARVGARPQPGGLDELGRHDPVRLLPLEHRSGLDGETGTSGTGVLATLGIAKSDVGQQP